MAPHVDGCTIVSNTQAEYNLLWHVIAVFIICACSGLGILGTIMIATSKKLQHNQIIIYMIQFFKFFGIGVILATAYVHLLPPAFEAFNNPCLKQHGQWHIYGTAYVGLFAMIASFLVQAFEFCALTRGDSHHHHQQHEKQMILRDTVSIKRMTTSIHPIEAADLHLMDDEASNLVLNHEDIVVDINVNDGNNEDINMDDENKPLLSPSFSNTTHVSSFLLKKNISTATSSSLSPSLPSIHLNQPYSTKTHVSNALINNHHDKNHPNTLFSSHDDHDKQWTHGCSAPNIHLSSRHVKPVHQTLPSFIERDTIGLDRYHLEHQLLHQDHGHYTPFDPHQWPITHTSQPLKLNFHSVSGHSHQVIASILNDNESDEQDVTHEDSAGVALSPSQDTNSIDHPPPQQHGYVHMMSTLFLELGTLFHSAIIGLALGTATDEFKSLLIALCFHQFFEGIALGVRIAEIKSLSNFRKMGMAMFYPLTTPLGMVVGMLIHRSYFHHPFTALVVQGIFDACSAGILFYNAYVELIAFEMNRNDTFLAYSTVLKVFLFFAVYLGAAAMSLLGLWI